MDAWNGLKDKFTDAVVGDAVSDVADAIEDTWELLTKGEVTRRFKIVNFDESIDWEYPSSDDDDSDNDDKDKDTDEVEVTAKLVQVEGNVSVYSKIFGRIDVSISSPQPVVEAGWRASNSAGFDVTLGAEGEATYEPALWEVKM